MHKPDLAKIATMLIVVSLGLPHDTDQAKKILEHKPEDDCPLTE